MEDKGFTLIELLVALGIIGILSGISISKYEDYRTRAKISRTASEIRGFVAAFVAYEIDHEALPPDSHRILPEGMEDYIDQSLWDNETPMGGYYNWEGPESYGYGGISIFDCPSPEDEVKILDRMLDDGDLSTGRFRTGSNGRPTYVIEEA